MLPYAVQGQTAQVRWQDSFGGLDMRLGAAAGAIAAMENMTGDHWPVMSTREGRRLYETMETPNGMGGAEELFWVDGTQFYYGGTAKGTVAAGEKRFCCLGSYVVILPDKLFYNSKTDEFTSLEASVTVSDATLCSMRSPSGLSTRCNALRLPNCDVAAMFAPDEAVRISGWARQENNKTLVIREISGEYLFFYDESFSLVQRPCYTVTETLAAGCYGFFAESLGTYFSFELDESIEAGARLVMQADDCTMQALSLDGSVLTTVAAEMGRWPDAKELEMDAEEYDWPQTGTVTVAREVPELEHMCQCSNRLWGVHGNTVACSYLGNPKVWYNFDSTATACWAVEVGSAGPFTAACAYGGYPLFFKEDRIYRVYGTKNANYQLFETETLGVESGSGKSLAVVGQTLYYKSRAGFVAYSGGVPRLIDAALGTQRWQDAVAGTDGRKYYVSCHDGTAWSLLVYDSRNGLWHCEDASHALDFAWRGELFMLREDGTVWMVGSVRSTAGESESVFESACEFAPMTGEAGGRDGVGRLYFRVHATDWLTAEVEYDGSGVWEKMTDIAGGERAMRTVELVPRRCRQFRIRLRGRGLWRLWALGWETAAGSRMDG